MVSIKDNNTYVTIQRVGIVVHKVKLSSHGYMNLLYCARRQWFGYLNFLRYAFGALAINQFQDRNVPLFGVPVLDYYGLGGYSAWEFLGYECIFFFGIFGLTWLALTYKKHVKR